MVRVRLFAALREAAGTDEVALQPGPLPILLDSLRERYGEGFTKVLALCTVLVDGSAVSREARIDVPDGAELALLPPVSGGSGSPAALPTRAPIPAAAAIPLACLAVAVVALAAGPRVFAIALLALTALALGDLAVLLDRGIARPVLAVAAIPGLLLPAAIAFDAPIGWSDLSAWFAGSLLALFAVLLLSGRRWGVVDVLGVTLLATLVVGLGAASLLMLRAEAEGLRLAGLVIALVAVVDISWVNAAAVPVAAGLTAIVGFVLGVGPALVLAVMMLAAIASVAAARGLLARLHQEGRLEPRPIRLPRAVVGEGVLFRALAATFLTAPIALIVVQAV